MKWIKTWSKSFGKEINALLFITVEAEERERRFLWTARFWKQVSEFPHMQYKLLSTTYFTYVSSEFGCWPGNILVQTQHFSGKILSLSFCLQGSVDWCSLGWSNSSCLVLVLLTGGELAANFLSSSSAVCKQLEPADRFAFYNFKYVQYAAISSTSIIHIHTQPNDCPSSPSPEDLPLLHANW